MSNKLKVLVIGSGGREHALVKAIKKSPMLGFLACTPGNGGIALDCETPNISVSDFDGIVSYCLDNAIDLVVCGPEVPLAGGLADELRSRGVAVYGPNKSGAMLEASKAFSKDFMKKYGVPTAAYENFKDFESAKAFIENAPFDVVVKASGLAAGKGVIVPAGKAEAVEAAREMLCGDSFGESGKQIVVEEKLEGEEASIMLMVCGKNYVMLPPSQDHKRVFDGDKGPNTGGMGAYAPAAVATESVLKDVRENIISPVLDGLCKEGIDYRGTLYIGIMITKSGAKVIEFNVRFGDPECQVLMPLVESDVLEALNDIALGRLDPSLVKIRKGYAATVVMCAGGYPQNYRKGDEITLPDIEDPDTYIIHAGTKISGGKLVTNGGRVLDMTAVADTLEAALEKAYALCAKASFAGAFYRKDIGYRQLRRNSSGRDNV